MKYPPGTIMVNFGDVVFIVLEENLTFNFNKDIIVSPHWRWTNLEGSLINWRILC